jgi:hypothetical protein
MAISTDEGILFFGTQDEVTSGTPATIASNAYGKADQGATVNWTNDDDAPHASAVLKCQFDTTMPTVGSIALYARLLNVQSTNDVEVPDANNTVEFVGAFKIDFGVANDVDFYAAIPFFNLPCITASQAIDWYIHNQGTSQTIGVSWQLWITPMAFGPHA